MGQNLLVGCLQGSFNTEVRQVETLVLIANEPLKGTISGSLPVQHYLAAHSWGCDL